MLSVERPPAWPSLLHQRQRYVSVKNVRLLCVFFYISKYCIDQEFDASYNSEMVLAKYDFDINGKTISNLLEQNEFVYFIPEFQRKVAWKAEFNQLLEDINEEFKKYF